jgi:hypothetical protein
MEREDIKNPVQERKNGSEDGSDGCSSDDEQSQHFPIFNR